MYNDEDEELEEEKESNGKNSALKELFEANKKIFIILGVIILIILISNISSCTRPEKPEHEMERKIKLVVESNELTVQLNNTNRIIYKLDYNRDDSKGEYTFESSNKEIVEVDNTGNIKGKKLGSATIEVKYKEGNEEVKEEIKVSVIEGNKDITLNNVLFPAEMLIISKNTSYTLAYSLEPSDGYIESREITSSNPSVATVTEDAVIETKSAGTTVITIKLNSNIKDTLTVKVLNENVQPEYVEKIQSLVFNDRETSIIEGQSAQLMYSFEPQNSTVELVEWTSSNDSICLVDEKGIVTGVKEGTCVITAKNDGVTLDKTTVKVTSKEVQPTKISWNLMDHQKFEVGTTFQIIPTIEPSNATNKTIKYSVLMGNVVTVTETGLLIANQKGTTTIIGTTTNGLRIQTTIEVFNKDDSKPVNPPSGGGSGEDKPSTTSCTSSNVISLKTNSSDYAGSGALTSPGTEGNAYTFTNDKSTSFKYTIEGGSACNIKSVKLSTSQGTGTFSSYYVKELGKEYSITLTSTQGQTKVLRLKFEVITNDGKIYEKEYSMKYSIGSTSSQQQPQTPQTTPYTGINVTSDGDSYTSGCKPVSTSSTTTCTAVLTKSTDVIKITLSDKNYKSAKVHKYIKYEGNSSYTDLGTTTLLSTGVYSLSGLNGKNGLVKLDYTVVGKDSKTYTKTYYIKYQGKVESGQSTTQITKATFQASFVKSKSDGGIIFGIGSTNYGLYTLFMNNTKDIDEVYYNINGTVDTKTATSITQKTLTDEGKSYPVVETSKTFLLNGSNFKTAICYEYLNNGATVKYNFAVKGNSLAGSVMRIKVVYKNGSSELKTITIS